MNSKSIQSLKKTAKNPRRLMQENGEKLDRSIDEMGSVDGIVMNINPEIDELVSGNQRTEKFMKNPTASIVITHEFDEPTATGSVAYGYVEVDGERWPYREVWWNRAKHIKGTELANMHAGEWDNDLRAERYHELLELDEHALDSMFITAEEVESLQDGWVDHEEVAETANDPNSTPAKNSDSYTIKQLRALRNAFIAETGLDDAGFIEWLAERE